MALPVKSDLLHFEFTYMGEPHVQVASKSGMSATHFDWTYMGEPFFFAEEGATSTTSILKVSSVAIGSLTKVVGITKANIKKLTGVANS
jgi:hypothetical protein